MREQMEMHRANEPCATCHKIMDPIGLSLENFDAIGKWRVTDDGSPIDPPGMLVDGSKIRRRDGLARGVCSLQAAVRAGDHGEVDDLRAGPRDRVFRYAR